MKTPIGPALRALLPRDASTDEEFSRSFRRAAELLLDHATLYAAGARHRLVEVEFYWAGPGHDDPFAHKDPIQVHFGVWYFHRQGGTYKGGTYKGVDIAAGHPGTHVGILLRAIEDMETGTPLIEGSCTVMDHILARTGHSSVAALAGSFDGSIEPSAASPLFLAHEDPGPPKEIFSSARVGLTLKKGATPERRRFFGKPYRFLSEPSQIKKGRPNLVASLHREGRSVAEIARITKMAPAIVGRYVAAFESGKGRDPADFQGDLSAEALSTLLGALG